MPWKCQRHTADTDQISKTDRWLWQYRVVKGAHDPHSVGAHRAPESSGSTCYRRRIVWTGVAARYIYRASGPVLAFDGIEMWC